MLGETLWWSVSHARTHAHTEAQGPGSRGAASLGAPPFITAYLGTNRAAFAPLTRPCWTVCAVHTGGAGGRGGGLD